MMEQLGITALRPGPSGNESAPNHANYDEALANPYPNLPEVLTLKSGRKVTSAAVWWKQRRPEIVEEFDREVLGRVPKSVPKVTWVVNRTENFTVGGRPVVGKELIGKVDNSSYPDVTVEIQMTVVTPAATTRPVPVMMMFGGRSGMPPAPGAPPPAARGFGAGRGAPPNPATPADPPATEQLIADGWGYATISPASIQADNGAGLTAGSSASSTRASGASLTTGARCARGRGAPRAVSTTSRPTRRWTQRRWGSKACRGTAKRRS